jgi:C1A family cysteine protease
MADVIKQRSVQRFGWIPDLPDARDHLFSAPQAVLDDLPAKVDLRPGCPPVYDQGQLGSCTANAINAAFQYMQRAQKQKDFMPSRLFVYYNERVMLGTVDTDSGAMIRDGVKSVAKAGVCREEIWPYDITQFTVKPSRACYTEALRNQVLVYRRVLNSNLHQLQGALASGTPVIFGFSVYESFQGQDVARTGIVPLPPRGETLLGGHAVLAVGYDDATQRFLVRNSWGEGWGDKGYCYMPYGYLTDPGLAQDFWAIYAVEVTAAKKAAKATKKAAKKTTKAPAKAVKKAAKATKAAKAR